MCTGTILNALVLERYLLHCIQRKIYSFPVALTVMSCCPSGSAPSFADDYTPAGTKVSYVDVQFYAVGTPSSGGKAIVVIPDIWGWDSGRIRRVADLLSANTGSYVVVPKLFDPSFEGGTDGDALPPDFDLGGPRAGECWPWLRQFNYEYVKPKTDSLFAHLKDLGIAAIAAVGFCWGGWLQGHLAVDHEIKCLVTPHPSIHSICGLLGESPADLISNVSIFCSCDADMIFICALLQVKIPWLLMPAGNDPAIYLPGGEVNFFCK